MILNRTIARVEKVLYYTNMVTITIPKTLRNAGDLVLISKKELQALILRANEAVGEKEILRLSREARTMKRAGKLPVLRSLRAL